MAAASVHFTPGARTAWHTHPFGQNIYVTEGVGRCQRRGGPVEVIRPGDRVFFEPGEDHWHGAAPNRFMTHLAMQEVDDQGSLVTWGEHVTRRGVRRRAKLIGSEHARARRGPLRTGRSAEVDVPVPGPGQILVRVHAAGLNRADLYMLEGAYSPSTKTGHIYVAGLELAGEVEAAGAGVQNLAVGDRVMASTLGAFAPFALLDHRHAIAVPASLGWTDAAALPVGLSTEHDALVTQAGFTAGDSVLIVGATSSVGLVGIQLAKALGAGLVIATTTSG